MDRTTLIHWFEEHPQAVSRDPGALVDRCEREVRKRATEDAWLAAKEYVEGREHAWERSWGFPRVSEAFVAKEVCGQLARELMRCEPHVAADAEEHLIGRKLLQALDSDSRAILVAWARELAEEEEHRVWLAIIRFTRGQGRALEKQGLLSKDTRPGSGNYFTKAAGIAHMLVDEYEAHAHPRPRLRPRRDGIH